MNPSQDCHPQRCPLYVAQKLALLQRKRDISTEPSFKTSFSTSRIATLSLTSSNSVSANSALSSATSLSNMTISNCSWASITRVSANWASCWESASSRRVAIRSVCNEFNFAWSLGRRETKVSASASRDSSSRTRWESSARLASRTRILARSSWSSWSSWVICCQNEFYKIC